MRRAGLLAGYAAASFLSFPHPLPGMGAEAVLDLGAWVSFLPPALWVLGLAGLAPGRAAGWGFGASLLAHSAILHWIYVVTVHYGHAPVWIGVAAPVALAAYIAAFGALLAAVLAWLERRRLASPWAVAAAWTAAEHLRSFAFTGFPWATLGYAQHLNPALAGLASATGVYGLSFTCALGGAALARGVRDVRAGRRPGRAVWAALAGVLALHGLGLALRTDPEAGGPTLRVAALQGNIDQGVKWSPAWVERTLAIYEDLSRRAAEQGARVIVWPESAVPGGLVEGSETAARLSALARRTGAVLVVGAVGLEFDARGAIARFFDSAYAFDRAGALTDRYDKSHLVPFGEYVPLRGLLGLTLRAVAAGMSSSDVTAGPGPRTVTLRVEGAGPEGASVGIPICYELLFPDLVRRFVRDGAQVLFAITNDAWYGRTGAPYQFLAMTALRSAETRVWTVRAANTGVSAIIDASGRVRARTRIFERDLLVGDVPLRSAPFGGSFYTRRGDVFAAACWLGLLGLAGVGRRGRRAKEAT